MSRQNTIRPYFISVLLEMGGCARVSLIRQEVESRMLSNNDLTQDDLELSSGQPKWENSLRALRQSLVKDGILKSGPRDFWGFTEYGLKYAYNWKSTHNSPKKY